MAKDATARHAARLQGQSHILVEESVKTTSEKNISDYMILKKTCCKKYRNAGTGARATRRRRTSRSSIGCELASTTVPTAVARPWRPLRARTTCVCATRRGGRHRLAHAPRRETAMSVTPNISGKHRLFITVDGKQNKLLCPETMQAPLAATAGTRLQPQCGALALQAAGMSPLTFWQARAHVSTLLRRKQVLVRNSCR